MDERLRKLERAIAEGGDALAHARRTLDLVRAERVQPLGLELAAHLGDPGARIALGLEEAKALATDEALLEWWRGFARFGREACVRAALHLARSGLGSSGYRGYGSDRFAGVPEEAWRAYEAFGAWIREPGTARMQAILPALEAAYNATEPAQGVSALGAVFAILNAEDLALAMAQFLPQIRYHYRSHEEIRQSTAGELLPWALAGRDPAAHRESDEGRSFAVDPDISRSVSFSPGGRLVLSSSRGGSVTIRQFPDGAIVRDFPRVRGEVFSARFSPDGTKVLAASQWGPCRLLDASTGEVIRTFLHPETVQDVAFVDDGRALTAGDDKLLKLWDLASGAELRSFAGHERMVRTVLVQGTLAVTESSDQTVRIWDLETGECRSVLPQPKGVESLALSPDGKRLLVGGDYGAIQLLDFPLGEEVRAYEGHRASVHGVAFTPDGLRFISVHASWTMEIRLWDLASGRTIRAWETFHALPFHVAVAPDGNRFVVGDRGGGLRVYEI